jgi:hypothetical protein
MTHADTNGIILSPNDKKKILTPREVPNDTQWYNTVT